jgi:hypothetical protein
MSPLLDPANAPGNYRTALTYQAARDAMPHRVDRIPPAAAHDNTSTFTVLLQPYRDTRLTKRPNLHAAETGALAAFGSPALELGSIEGDHPHAARVNMGHSCPPGSILAVNASLSSAAEVMSTVVHIVDSTHRTSLVMNLRVTFNQEARDREAAALAAEQAKAEELRARLETAHAEVGAVRLRIEAELKKTAAVEHRLHAALAERDAMVQREEGRRIELERLREHERRRIVERQAVIEKEQQMERLRDQEKRDLEQRARERDAERRAEEDRQREREAERRGLSLELQRIEMERQQFARERQAYESERRLFESERDRFMDRETEWRMHLHKALTEVSVCKACSARLVTEQHLRFTQERLERALDEKGNLEAELARLRVDRSRPPHSGPAPRAAAQRRRDARERGRRAASVQRRRYSI